jgi:hypothetical protein
MEKSKYLLILLILGLASCIVNYGVQTKEFIEKNAENDGLSYDNAIIILRSDHRAGVHDEYEYIKIKYPNSKILSQTLTQHGFTNYDIIEIETSDSLKKLIYFDINNFFSPY